MHEVVVLGASLAGLWTAAAAAGAGARVLLVERDQAPVTPAPRAGVPQGAQPHVFLHRGLRAAEELLPGLRRDLVAAGAVTVDTGLLPWLGEHGWLPQHSSYEVLSLSRPLLEQVVRQRVLALPGVAARWGVRARGLDESHGGVRVRVDEGPDIAARVVVDATGRGSRLRTWLAEIGIATPEPLTVDARLGYTTQLIRGGPDPGDLPGVVVQAVPESPCGGSALPVEGRGWLVTAAGFGDLRPPRDLAGLTDFLLSLRDPALAAILRSGQPVGEPAVHRQTSNRRHRYSQMGGWPEGVLAVGDALCCFDPVYGQGITVSACEALRVPAVLGSLLGAGSAGDRTGAGAARKLLRDFDRVIDFPWVVAIGQDLQMPSCTGRQSRAQAAVSAWASAITLRAVNGNRRAYDVLTRTYHLEGSPRSLMHPALIGSVAFGRLRRSRPAPRPEVLDTLPT